MQRTICRFIRGTCRKFRDNDCPVIASEEVRQKNKSKEDFTPPKHTFSEALGWTTGIILTYELTHRRRQCYGDTSAGTRDRILMYIRNCPFAIAKAVYAQPTLNRVSTAKHVRSAHASKTSMTVKKTIDTTPFLLEPEKLFAKDSFSPGNYVDSDSEDDGGVYFDPKMSKFDETRSNRPPEPEVASYGEKLASDLFSVMGAMKMLCSFKGSQVPSFNDSSVVEALDILEKGVGLGSSRALYNMGVAYDRMNESALAKEYYSKAALLGHPLACYNVAVDSMNEGNVQEGLPLMKYAAQHGVYEAAEAMKDLPVFSSHQVQV